MPFAKGKHALGECARSGRVMKLKDMVRYGLNPNLLVDPDWREPKPPSPRRILPDAQVLKRPAPERSFPPGEGEAAPPLSIPD